MSRKKEANGNNNTQVGKNLTNEKIKINNLNLTINLNNFNNLELLEKLLERLKFKKINGYEKINGSISILSDNNICNRPEERNN